MYAVSVYLITKCDRFSKFLLFTLLFLYYICISKITSVCLAEILHLN